MSKKNHCGVLVVFLVIAILPPGFAMAQQDQQWAQDALAKCKEGKCDEGIKLADQIGVTALKEKTKAQIKDQENTNKAIEICTQKNCTESRSLINQIKDNGLKEKTLAIIADQEKANEAIELTIAGQRMTAYSKALEIKDTKKRENTIKRMGDQEATKFWSNFGVGLISNFASGQKRPVKSASIINGIVRVDEEDYLKYGLGLEVHKFLWGTSWGASPRQPFSGAIAVGPYVSVLPGTNNLIDAIGGGIIMGIYGARTSHLVGETPGSPAVPESIGSKLSMNIAIGGFADPGTQVLADGFEENKPAPAGETTVRYKTITQYGFQFLLSFSYEF